MARKAGLTLKQYLCYSRWYAGWTHREIAADLRMRRSRVTECIARARRRRPNDRRPPRVFPRNRANVRTETLAA